MSKRPVFKSDEELYEALDEISEVYNKPPTNSEYLFVGIWLVLLPIIGIIGYVSDLSWLFYIIGGIITLTEIFLLFTGALRCLGSVLLILSCIISYVLTKSIWTGLLLGSCITGSLLGISHILIMGFPGMSTIAGWFKWAQ